MTTVLQKGIAVVGVGRQTTQGTIVLPDFAHGVTGGKPFAVEVDQEADAITSGYRSRHNSIRTGARASVEFDSRAYLKVLGLYLHGVFGSAAHGGSGPSSYTHTYTVGDTLPWLSMYSRLDGTYQTVEDVKIDELSLAWDGPGPVELSVKGLGCDYDLTAASWSLPASPETDSEAFLVPVGGTFTLDAVGSSPATAVIKSGEIKVANALEPIVAAGQLVPLDHAVKDVEISGSLTVTPASLDDFAEILTGSTSGAMALGYPQYGSFAITFKENHAGTGTLALTATRVAFMAEMPEPAPDGGPVEIELSFLAHRSSATSPLTAVLTNAVAGTGTGYDAQLS